MGLVEQLSDDSWEVVCADCCRMALVFAICNLFVCACVCVCGCVCVCVCVCVCFFLSSSSVLLYVHKDCSIIY